MSSVLDPSELAASPLADLHLLANELGLDGYRRLRKAELIDAILVAQGGEPVSGDAAPSTADARAGDDSGDGVAEAITGTDAESGVDEDRPRRRSRGGRSRSRRAAEETEEATVAGDEADATEEEDRPRRRSRGGRGRGRSADDDGGSRDRDRDRDDDGDGEDEVVEGVIDLAPNGSGFVRLTEGETSDDDVYISAAQIKRCELVAGDRVAGPMRPPRRSERYPSLIRVDTINGRPADEVAGEGTRFEDLPATFPSERLELGSEDPTVKAIEWLTPFGRGSRVTVVGPTQAGKTEALLRLAGALDAVEGVELSVALAGARPEELPLWAEAGITPAAAAPLGQSPEAQLQAIEPALDQAKRIAARGGHAVLVVDSLDQVAPAAARRLLSAARNVVDGGSLTIVAGAAAPVGGETTIIALDAVLTGLRRFPAVDLAASGTLRPELLVGEAGAEAIAKARAETLR